MAAGGLAVKERILLHLFDYSRFAKEAEAPAEVTPAGIAKAAGIQTRRVPQHVMPLQTDGLIEERMSRVQRKPRRRRVYFLTVPGRHQAASLRRSVLKKTVTFTRMTGQVNEVSLSKVYQEERRGARLLELLEELTSEGFIAEATPPTSPSLIDYAQQAPAVEKLYGRENELTQILHSLERSPLVVVTGMAGIGKTTLGAKIYDVLREKRPLFWRRLRPWDTAAELAFRLAGFLKGIGRMRLHGYLAGSGRKELGRVEDLLIEDLTGSRVLIVLDDVHVGSEDARTFLSILYGALKEAKGSSCLLLSRTTPDFYSRREVDVEGSVTEHSLGGLDHQNSEALLSHAGIKGPRARRLAEVSSGNPLFLKLLGSGGPEEGVDRGWRALETYIAEEIEPNLEEDEMSCLQVAALYEIPVPSEGFLLEKTGGRKTLIGLERKGLIGRLDSGEVQTHDFIRGYFGKGLPAERRESLKEKVVGWLASEAGSRADDRDYDKAIAMLENAVLLDENQKLRLEHLEKLGRLRETVGDFASSIETYREALEEASAAPIIARLHYRIARVLLTLISLEDGENEIIEGLKLLPARPSLEAGRLHAIKAHLEMLKDNYDGALKEVERVIGWMRELPEDLDLSGYLAQVRGFIHLWNPARRDLALALDDFHTARDAWRNSGNAPNLAWALTALGDVSVQLGKVEEGLRYYDESVALADELGDSRGRLVALFNRAGSLQILGRLDEAEAQFEETFHLAKAFHPRYRLIWHYPNLARGVYYWQGRYDEARESYDYFLQATWDTDMITDGMRVDMQSGMVELCLLCNDREAAEAHLELAQDLAARVSSEEARSSVEVAKALLQADRGEHEKAESSFVRALESQSTDRRKTLLHYGRFLAARGEGERARAVLLEARAESDKWSSKPFIDAVREALESLDPETVE